MMLPAMVLAYWTLRTDRRQMRELESHRTFMSRHLPENLVRRVLAGERLDARVMLATAVIVTAVAFITTGGKAAPAKRGFEVVPVEETLVEEEEQLHEAEATCARSGS